MCLHICTDSCPAADGQQPFCLGRNCILIFIFPQRSRKDDFNVQINMIRFRDTQTTFPSGRILPSLIITPQSQSLTLPIRQSLYTCPNLDPRLSRNDENRN